MSSAPLPPDEQQRLAALQLYNVLDTLPEQNFDDITRLASSLCATPIGLISLLDETRQWFKSSIGLDMTEIPRDLAFCAHVILQPHVFVVPNALHDARFVTNPLVTGNPQFRFYAGAPLLTSSGYALGTLCVIDRVPRELTPPQKDALQALARQVVALLELRHQLAERAKAEAALQQAHDELEQRVAERTQALRQQEQFLRKVLDTDPSLIFVKDANGVFTLANQALATLYGTTPEELVGKSDADFNPNAAEVAQFLADDREVIHLRRDKFLPAEVVTDAQGRTHWRQTVKRPLTSPDGTVAHVLGICTDITARKEAEEKIAHQAFHDTLTDLPNRALLLNRLEQALARAARTGDAIGVLFVDLDNFKVTNDSLGHEAGDTLLQTIAERLSGCVRPGDTVARLGGDEFVMLLEELCGTEEAQAIAQRATEAVHLPLHLGERDVFPSASIGLTLTVLSDVRTAGDLLRDADTAMYQAKLQGKGCYALFDLSMNTRAQERLELEGDMRQAIVNEEFVLHYQPIMDMQSGRMAGMEALVRWQHPTRGLVSPAKFIPIAEENGLIVPLGRWVLRQACVQARQWQTDYPDGLPLVMSVNLSIRQMLEKDIVAQVVAILEETGLAPEHLKLEITESMMLHDTETTIATMTALQKLGIRLAIDDFGTGYSSMAYLSQLPLNTLKIDRSFINRMGESRGDEAIVRAIINLARTLHLSVTCEGIETQEQYTYLKELGCERGQGYLMHKPLPAAQIGALLAGVGNWLPSEKAVPMPRAA